MKTQKSTLIAAVVCLLLAASVQAVTVRLDPGDDTIAIGIENLNVNGTLYNVTFPSGSADELYGLPTKVYDFDTEATANAAVDAVNATLNSVPTVTMVKGDDTAGGDPVAKAFFLIGYFDQGNQVTFSRNGDYDGVSWINDGDFSGGSAVTQKWADFTVVPEPCTALLLSLGGLGLFRRKKSS